MGRLINANLVPFVTLPDGSKVSNFFIVNPQVAGGAFVMTNGINTLFNALVNNPAFRNGIVLRDRPVKKVVFRERAGAEIVAQGVFLRRDEAGKTVGQLMQTDYLSYRTLKAVTRGTFDGKLPSEGGLSLNTDACRPGEGFYLLVDLGRQHCYSRTRP